MNVTRRLGWSVLCLVSAGCFACSFDPAAAVAGQPAVAGAAVGGLGSSSAAGAATTSGGSGAAGSVTMPTAGDAATPQGGQVTQGGTGGVLGGGGAAGNSAGSDGMPSGGMSVAGGPPVYTAKPMSVVAYSPYRDGQAPGGAQPSKDQVKEDLLLLKPYVDGVRVYGTDGANAYIPALCDELGIDLHIGAWIDGLNSDEPNVHALAKVVNENHPSIKTAIVGNEVLARSAKNLVTEARLIELINIYKKDVTVNTVKTAAADTYPQWMMNRPNLAAAVDIVIWHTYGWWSGVDVNGAYTLVSKRYDDMLALYPSKPLILGETGWPSMYDHLSMDSTSTAVGSEENQAKFYREALTGMRARNLPMWMFSAIDEKWKGTSGEGMVGAYWGIWDSARKPKAAVAELLKIGK